MLVILTIKTVSTFLKIGAADWAHVTCLEIHAVVTTICLKLDGESGT